MRRFNTKKVVLVLSALLIVLVGMIAVLRSGSTQAVLTESEEQTLKLTMSELGVTLLENGKDTEKLLTDFQNTSLDPGRTYADKISVKNSGAYFHTCIESPVTKESHEQRSLSRKSKTTQQ